MSKKPIIGIIVAVLLVSGYFVFSKKATAPIVNEQQNSLVTTTTNEDISNWKTYRNDKYSFEFKYPTSATIKDNISNIVVNSQNGWVQIWTEDQGRGWFEGQAVTSQERITVGGIKTMLFNYGINSYSYIEKDSHRYSFVSEDSAMNTGLLKNILSTFKFTK